MSGATMTSGPDPRDRAAGGGESLHLGDAIAFLDAKRAGGRGEKTINDYRKKLHLFQRWLASRAGPEEVDVPYDHADAVEAYAVHLRDARGLADSSRKSHLAVLKSFFETASRRLKLANPFDDLDEVRFRQVAPKRLYLTKTEAGILFSAMERAADAAPEGSPDGRPPQGAPCSPPSSPPATTPPSRRWPTRA